MKNCISIIIPTKDRAASLKRVLCSYFNQKYVKEVIIIDDGSKDGTEKYINKIQKTYKNLTYLKNTLNQGPPSSKNKGIRYAKGEFIFIGEDDVKLEKDHLSILLAHLNENKAHIAAGRIIYVDPGETQDMAIKKANRLTVFPVNKKLVTTNYSTNVKNDIQLPISHALMLINKKVLKKVKYDEKYKVNFWREETDFQLSAAEQGFKLIYCPHTVSYHLTTRKKGGCRSTNKLNYEYWVFKNNIYFIKKHLKYLKVEFEIRSFYYYLFIFSLYRFRWHFLGLINRFKLANFR
jgi:GT2 family glycosyltransferase